MRCGLRPIRLDLFEILWSISYLEMICSRERVLEGANVYFLTNFRCCLLVYQHHPCLFTLRRLRLEPRLSPRVQPKDMEGFLLILIHSLSMVGMNTDDDDDDDDDDEDQMLLVIG